LTIIYSCILSAITAWKKEHTNKQLRYVKSVIEKNHTTDLLEHQSAETILQSALS
jgi:hypothetical protein